MAIFVQLCWGFPGPTDFRNYGSVQQNGRNVVYLVCPHCGLPLLLWISFGSMAQLVCLVMRDFLLLLPLCTNINMILKHAYRFLIFFSLLFSVSHVSGIPRYYWSDQTPEIENMGRAELEIYSCKRFSGGTLLLCWDTWRCPGGMSAICSPQPH